MAKFALSFIVAMLVAVVAAEHGWGHGGGGHEVTVGGGGGGEGGGGGGGGHGHGGHQNEGWGWSHPKYKYSYGVKDSHTKDYHSASEYRDGDAVHGSYSLLEPTGEVRTVTYTADKGGFKAHVHRTGWKA